MSKLTDRYYEDDFSGYLEELIESDSLEGAALGVAKQAAVQGVDSLSDKQRFVLDRHVIDEHAVESCDICAAPIPWCEMFHAEDNGHLCSWCWNQVEKNKRDD